MKPLPFLYNVEQLRSHYSSQDPCGWVIGPASQLSFPFYPILLPSLFFRRCWFKAESTSQRTQPVREEVSRQGSVQFSRSVMSDPLQPHGLQHTRLSCPLPTPGDCSNSYPSSRWCHPTLSSSVVPFSSCLQSFPASGSFQMSQFALGGQSVGDSASVLPMNIQDWFPLGWTGWISLQSKGLSRVFSNTTVQKHQFFSVQLSLYSKSHIHTYLLEKP